MVVTNRPMGKFGSKWTAPIKEFKIDGSIQALLLPIERAGRGLCLIEATNLYLMEPVEDKTSECTLMVVLHKRHTLPDAICTPPSARARLGMYKFIKCGLVNYMMSHFK
jgi:hypothetical protein